MNKIRLLRLAAFLETLPAKAFDMGLWQTKALRRREGRRPGQCGFVGCAAGWAAHQKLIPGLTLEPIAPRSKYIGLRYKKFEDFDAAAAAFDLAGGEHSVDEEVDYLFGANAYDEAPYDGRPTPFDVARRIRRFVKAGGRPSDDR